MPIQEAHSELGQIIRDYRLKKNMTQLDLAKRLGYDSTQFVSLFERGLSKVPFNVLGQLIVILGIPERKILNMLLGAYETELKARIDEGKKNIAM